VGQVLSLNNERCKKNEREMMIIMAKTFAVGIGATIAISLTSKS
jgi:hypothetical protein